MKEKLNEDEIVIRSNQLQLTKLSETKEEKVSKQVRSWHYPCKSYTWEVAPNAI